MERVIVGEGAQGFFGAAEQRLVASGFGGVLPDLIKALESESLGVGSHSFGRRLVLDGDAAIECGDGCGEFGEAVDVVGELDLDGVRDAVFCGGDIFDGAGDASEKHVVDFAGFTCVILEEFDLDGFLFIVKERVGAFDGDGDRLVGKDQGFIAKIRAVTEERDHVDAESVGCDVCKDEALLIIDQPCEHGGFGGSAKSDGKIRVNICTRFFAKNMSDKFLDGRDIRRSTNEQYAIDGLSSDLSDAKGVCDALSCAIEERCDGLVEVLSREMDIEVDGFAFVECKHGHVEMGVALCGEGALGAFDLAFEHEKRAG